MKIYLLLIFTILITFFLLLGCQSTSDNVDLSDEQLQKLETAYNLASNVPYPELDEVRRGCPSCHILIDQNSGKYTLAYEAYAATKNHPEVFQPTDEVNVTTCLGCHSPGTGDRENKGTNAPISLRDIVHPAHMSSQTFKLHYGGSCFTCHNINGLGEFELLTERVEVDTKGIPDPSILPIPGAQ